MKLDTKLNQREFGTLIGISQPAVSDLISRKVIDLNDTAGMCLKKYCAHLREQSAGRAGALAEARTRESNERADKIALENKVTRRELAPINIIEQTMSSVGRQIAGILEALPVKLKREAKLKTKQVKIVEREISIARNVAAAVQPEWDQIDSLEED